MIDWTKCDPESRRLLAQLPRSGGRAIVPVLKALSLPFFLVGAWGVGSILWPLLINSPYFQLEWNQRHTYYLERLALAAGLLAAGAALWNVAQWFAFTKAPVGDLVDRMTNALTRGKPAERPAAAIDERVSDSDTSTAALLAKGLALLVLIPTCDEPDSARDCAQDAERLFIHLRESGVDSPFLAYCLDAARQRRQSR